MNEFAWRLSHFVAGPFLFSALRDRVVMVPILGGV